jgi:uncharacterized protein
MRTITLEEHVSTPEYLDAVGRVNPGAVNNPLMAAMRPRLLDIGDARIADMDASRIDMQVLSLTATEMDQLDPATATAVARDSNDRIAAAVRAHPDRFAAFAALAIQDPVAASHELERAVSQLHCKGAMINGTTNGLFLDHPKFTPVLEAAQALHVPLYLHPAPPPSPVYEAYYTGLPDPFGMLLSIAGWGWHTELGLHALRLIVSGVFDRFPRLQIIIGHMGEDLPFSLARAEAVLSRASSQMSRKVSDYFHDNFHVTTSGYFTTPPFLCALSVVGADRLMFSVDYPFSPNTTGRAFLDALPVAPADLRKIAHANAERLLGL